MEGEATDILFNIKGCRVKVVYLNGSKAVYFKDPDGIILELIENI